MQKYGWYVMPPTLHKLLEHGYEGSDILDLPLGVYSEEAQEAQNKEIRNARLNHSCKISRTNVMTNQLHYLLIRSDPVISSKKFRKTRKSGKEPLEESVLALVYQNF